MTYHLEDDDDDKYSFATPEKVFECLERTLKEGGVPDKLVLKDWDRIWELDHDELTWERIVEAMGGYIEDIGKRIRSGVRREVEVAQKAEKVLPSPVAESKFREMYDKLAKGGDFGNAAWMKKMQAEGFVAPDTAEIDTAVDVDDRNDDDEDVEEALEDEEGTEDEMEIEDEEEDEEDD
mmetsp:Transcript_27038/g.54636  ORF Transcript_27038/g.54636 Transcript_27038/m.54636 type:complete len:179 (+) Transcript_27038:310-846(+)